MEPSSQIFHLSTNLSLVLTVLTSAVRMGSTTSACPKALELFTVVDESRLSMISEFAYITEANAVARATMLRKKYLAR
jgi:hypothetical protein